jgi:hypothetical protein
MEFMTTLLQAGVRMDPRMIETLKAAAKRGVTKDQIHQQRVNYIVAAMSDEKTKITTEMVERELGRLSGDAA